MLDLTGKTAKERANLKGIEIARLATKQRHVRGSLHIELVDILPIEGGVEVFARAWKGKKQIGFGTDGSVDIERFRIFNPPILVEDPNGPIEIVTKDSIDNDPALTRVRRLREDPQEAIIQVIEHNLSVMKNIHNDTKIVQGKRGNTTSTFYPDASPETSTVDGYALYDSTAVSWSSLVAVTTANSIDDSTDEILAFYVRSGSASTWNRLTRTFTLFDTSTIPDTDTITSATVSLYGISKRDDNVFSPEYDIGVFTSAPASDTAVATGDFDSLGTTDLATPIGYSSLSVTGYNNWSLNATGIATISKTGVTKLGFRNSNYDAAGVDPGAIGGSNLISDFRTNAAEHAGTTNDPKLVVEHAGAATVSNFQRHTLLTLGVG